MRLEQEEALSPSSVFPSNPERAEPNPPSELQRGVVPDRVNVHIAQKLRNCHAQIHSFSAWVRISDPSNTFSSLSKLVLSGSDHASSTACQRVCRGWAVTSTQVVWFAETWNVSEVRSAWPCQTQLALLQAARSLPGRLNDNLRKAAFAVS